MPRGTPHRPRHEHTRNGQNTWNDEDKRAYSVLLLVVHKRGYGPAGVGMITDLTVNTDGGMTNTKMVDGTRDSTGRGRH